MRNIEIKVRRPTGPSSLGTAPGARDLERILIGELHAKDAGLELQHDIFFHCPRGRLKLRQVHGRPAQLIHYERADAPEVRPSDYRLVEVAEPDPLLAILDGAFGRLGEVRKRRHVFLIQNIRVHLDEVEGLGMFIEIEAAVDAAHDEAAGRKATRELLRALGAADCAFESRAYVDLLLAR
jgi:predicted adenylyl cyclase CyaB